ncbi:putative kinesin [Trypanosoma grayi]|uniref:putative kinesin n=1 Tax=Trypanosoma grayi TaxID=71804 RepID=UPI0004F463F1|nr:putative kinesin [Trypanosoma grayi]KEG14441.1 putative kinesin [Trypanosoma grayi]
MADQVVAGAAVHEGAAESAAKTSMCGTGEENSAPRKSMAKASRGSKEDGHDHLNRCLVYCRLRPTNKTDYKDGSFQLVTVENNSVVVKDERHYNYDGAFDEYSTQEQIFDAVVVPCVTHALEGFCSALMCYGQTGTGKTYTMCNNTPGNEGIIPRVAKFLFDKVQSDTTRRYEIIGQFVQIYRDHLGDLMTGHGRDRVDIRYDEETGVELTGCSSHVLQSAQEFMRFYQTGNERRVVTATAMNPESSRGHTALIVRIISEGVNDPLARKIRGKITFIDLAGYERFSKTGITHENPIMKDEAKCINASLLSLSHVVSALSSGVRHIPWRNSKLTRILQDSVGGRSRTSIILTVGPSSDHLHATTNSLQFGLRAMAVKVSAKQYVSVDYEELARKLQSLLNERDEKINLLELQIASRSAEQKELVERYEEHRADLNKRFESDMAHLKEVGASEEQMQKLREVYRAEEDNLQEQQNEEIQYQEEARSKEIMKLIHEQEHQEGRRRAEMKLAQERIIDEFQGKLDKAREGTNDDLINALQQLSVKDSILASRANDTARLHEHIEVLTEQIKELGGVPVQEANFPETFLDVGQVEEIQRQLEAEVERQRSKVVELRAQIDRLSLTCSERVEEINKLRDENVELRFHLQKSGVELGESDELTEFLREKRAMMVDGTKMETLRVTMQADLDELKARNEELVRELERLKTERSQHSLPLTARIRGTARGVPPLYPQPGTGRCVGASRHFFLTGEDLRSSSYSSQSDTAQKSVKQLSDQLAFSLQEKTALQERVRSLESMMASHGLAAPQPYVPPIKLELPGMVPAMSNDHKAEVSPDTDVGVLLKVKDDEIETLLETIERQEYLLATARSNDEFHQQVISELHQVISAAELVPPEHRSAPPPVESIAMDEYMNILRVVRDGERKVASLLAERDGNDPVDVELILEEKDKELQLKEELVIEKASKAQYVARLCIRLKNQMERLDIVPCCQLPESYRELIGREECELEDQIESQRDLEGRLHAQEMDRLRMEKMLRTLNEEREREAVVIRSANARCKEAEQKEMYARAELVRLSQQKSQKEVTLEDALRKATRELMDNQARLAKLDEIEKGGFLKLLFRFHRS